MSVPCLLYGGTPDLADLVVSALLCDCGQRALQLFIHSCPQSSLVRWVWCHENGGGGGGGGIQLTRE